MYSSQGWKVVLVHQEALHSPSHRTHVQQTGLHKTESRHILIGMKTGTTTNIEIVSHRGAAFEAPENTIPGFEHAIRLGMTTVEFDVHITADDQLVVIHDATVDRTTNGTGAVNQMTLSELQALDARAIHTDWPEPCRIPTFEETLRALAGMPNMEVEIKSDTPENMRRVVEKLVEVTGIVGRTEGIVITSMVPLALEIAMELAPQFPRGFNGFWDKEETFEIAARFDVSLAGIDLRGATRDIVQRARSLGYRTVAWSANTPEQVEVIKAYGYDEAGSDAPTLIAPLFGRPINDVTPARS